MQWRKILRPFVPPLLWQAGRLLMGEQDSLRFYGPVASWEDALGRCAGYGSPLILEAAKQARLKVERGEAAWERDGVAFSSGNPPFPLLCAILVASLNIKHRLVVLDYGGALGSSYTQCRHFLKNLPEILWLVVEQPHIAQCGRELFESSSLRFFDSIEDASRAATPDIVVLSGVLQYLSRPYEVLATLVKLRASVLFIDRTSFSTSADLLTVQLVPSVHSAISYPCWFLDQGAVLSMVAEQYLALTTFDCPEGFYSRARLCAHFRGILFSLKNYSPSEKA